MATDKKSEKAETVFVLADTHNRLPESVKEIAKGADEIWHLGDVCAQAVLDELRTVGPRVTVVRGNCDSNFEWPLVCNLVRGGLKCRVLFLNPGCVTRPNRGAPPSVAWLEITDAKITWKLIPLR